MQRVPELIKARSGESGGKKAPIYYTVSNVDADVCMKRFRMIGVKSLVLSDVEIVSATSYRFPVSDKYNMVFADKLEVRDKIDKQVVPKLFQFIKAAHIRGMVLSDINLQTIGVCIADGSAKVIDLSTSKLCVPGSRVEMMNLPNLYHAPEVHATRTVSFASDIYSLGLWWLVARSGSTVESWNLTCPSAINAHAMFNNPKFDILRRMLNVNPYLRPTIQEVIMEYHRENAEANVVQEQLTASQSDVLRIFKGDSGAIPKLLDEVHHSTLVDAMPSILRHVFSNAPHYKSDAFKYPGNMKTLGDLLVLLNELMMKDKNPFENFVSSDFVDVADMILSFMAIDAPKGLMVASRLFLDKLFLFTREFGIEAIPLCSTVVELKTLVEMLPRDDCNTSTYRHFVDVAAAEDSSLKQLTKRYDALVVSNKELLAEYEECWTEYYKVWGILEEIENDTKNQAEKVVRMVKDASDTRKRRREG